MPKLKLRNFILTGLALCVLALVIISIFNPDFRQMLVRGPKLLALITLVLVWNTYAAIRWTHPVAMEDSLALHIGVRWGLAIGCGWGLVAIVPLNVFTPNDEVGAPSGSSDCSPGSFCRMHPVPPARLRAGVFRLGGESASGAE